MTQPFGEPIPELKTSAEWLKILYPGYKIIDHDGWRSDDAPDFNLDAITEDEFQNRYTVSTVAPLPRR